MDELPIGGGKKGGYNLDALDQMEGAFGGGDVMMTENKPKRAPPARFANKSTKPPAEEEKTTTPNADIVMTEEPGDAFTETKPAPVKKPPPKLEEKKTAPPSKPAAKPTAATGGPKAP